MTVQARIQSGRISRRQALAVVAALALVFRAGARGSARQALVEGSLLVRGQAELPGSQMAWRVVQDVAEVGDDAGYQRRALGFTVNSGIFTDLLLTDEVTGSAYRLAPGEAAFVAEGTMQRRESLGNSPEQYLRLALAPADMASDAGGDRLVYAGPAFAAPAGAVTLALEHLDLQAGDVAYASPGAGQVLILVLQGEIEIEEGEAGPRTRLQAVVGSSTSYAVHATPWGATITALRDATYVLVGSMR
ncbi:MAG: hypothetical protein R2853_12740 [Thermomicrobiales bacterium]